MFIFDRIHEKSVSTGKTFATVSKEWRNDITGTLTLETYAALVRRNLKAYFLDEGHFLNRFAFPPQGTSAELDRFNRFIIGLNSALWRIGLPFFVLVLLVPWRLAGAGWWLGLLYRLTFCCFVLQAFLSRTGGRYYIGLVPVLAASTGIAPSVILDSIAGAGRRRACGPRQNEALFRFVEWAMPITIGVVLAIIFVSPSWSR